LEGLECRVVAEQGGQQLFGARGRQRIDPDLDVVRLAPPGVLILGTVADEEQDARGWEARDQTVEQRLALPVDPVEILEEHEERRDLTFPEEEARDRVQDPLPALRRL